MERPVVTTRENIQMMMEAGFRSGLLAAKVREQFTSELEPDPAAFGREIGDIIYRATIEGKSLTEFDADMDRVILTHSGISDPLVLSKVAACDLTTWQKYTTALRGKD